MTGLPWLFNDGGRADAGYTGDTGDCVTRAVAIASGRPYQEIYDALYDGARTYAARGPRAARAVRDPSPRNGVLPRVYRPYVEEVLGARWTPTMSIGSGCTVHLAPGELPDGRLLVRLSRHLTAVIDGAAHDTYDPCREGTRCVYGFWRFP